MTQVTQPGGSETAESGSSTTEQAKEKAQETAQQVQQQVGQKAQEVKGQTGERVRSELDTRSTQAGEQVSSTANAMRRVGEQLRSEGNETPARLVDQGAERAERLGRYLTEADADRMLRDAENVARRQPWLVALGGVVVGFLAARFVKASSSRRYQAYEADRYEFAVPPTRQPALPAAGDPAMASFGEEAFVAGTPSPTGPIVEGVPGGRPEQ